MARSESPELHWLISTISDGTTQHKEPPSFTKWKILETSLKIAKRPILGFKDHELEDEGPIEKLPLLIVATIANWKKNTCHPTPESL
jgi:hypothetical protein